MTNLAPSMRQELGILLSAMLVALMFVTVISFARHIHDFNETLIEVFADIERLSAVTHTNAVNGYMSVEKAGDIQTILTHMHAIALMAEQAHLNRRTQDAEQYLDVVIQVLTRLDDTLHVQQALACRANHTVEATHEYGFMARLDERAQTCEWQTILLASLR